MDSGRGISANGHAIVPRRVYLIVYLIVSITSYILLLYVHAGGCHFGRDKTLPKAYICERFYWRDMTWSSCQKGNLTTIIVQDVIQKLGSIYDFY